MFKKTTLENRKRQNATSGLLDFAWDSGTVLFLSSLKPWEEREVFTYLKDYLIFHYKKDTDGF